MRPPRDPYAHLDDHYLSYWLHRAKACYLEDVTDPSRKKDGTRTAGVLASIENERQTILALTRELTRRGYRV